MTDTQADPAAHFSPFFLHPRVSVPPFVLIQDVVCYVFESFRHFRLIFSSQGTVIDFLLVIFREVIFRDFFVRFGGRNSPSPAFEVVLVRVFISFKHFHRQ